MGCTTHQWWPDDMLTVTFPLIDSWQINFWYGECDCVRYSHRRASDTSQMSRIPAQWASILFSIHIPVVLTRQSLHRASAISFTLLISRKEFVSLFISSLAYSYLANLFAQKMWSGYSQSRISTHASIFCGKSIYLLRHPPKIITCIRNRV